jgi:alkanesulfonate monooxygenase SsuD/methylene tetrahydromethanopterin reductase-like flavin-dependent oxidoreductase (luciferase family)
MDRFALEQMLTYSVIGAPESVRQGLEAIIASTAANELMVAAQIYDHASRLRSYELTAQVRDALNAQAASVVLRSSVTP